MRGGFGTIFPGEIDSLRVFPTVRPKAEQEKRAARENEYFIFSERVDFVDTLTRSPLMNGGRVFARAAELRLTGLWAR